MKSPLQAWRLALLGPDRRQQMAMTLTLSAVAVYAVCIAAQWLWVALGHVTVVKATLLTVIIVIGQITFVVMLRSGWSQRFRDLALSMPQMIFALVCLAFAYCINSAVSGVLLMIAALVLVFGAFTLRPRDCRRLGWLAQAIFSGAMVWGVLTDPLRYSPWVELITFLFSFATLPLVGVLAGRLSQMRLDLKAQKRELQAALESVQLLATRDQLTGLPNRRYLDEWLLHELPRMRRSVSPMCVALIDLDHFKQVNDRHGHSMGDQVLKNFAAQSRHVLRETDALVRWGGEEFVIVMPDTPQMLGAMIVQRLREHLEDESSWEACPEGRVTVSAGLVLHQVEDPFEHTLARADAAVYEAKRLGRNRCVEA